MSWQLGAFALLGLALGAGFAWYERTRPDARIVALVATLAAFAALGRIAFAAVPNIKPTTDIVLVAGFVLGGGPGFAVGALAGLSSNFFFGQGPWTPWQMAAWGATGVIGAGLAWGLSRRDPGAPPRISRLALAAACGVIGFAFTVVQDVGDWVTYSDHSLRQLTAYVGQGLGFDAVHAIGCVAFALALGPALIHSLRRFSSRLQVRWVTPGSAFPLLLLAAMATLGVARSAVPGSARAAGASGSPTAYLLGAQNPDGGFGAGPGQASSQLYSGWAALGLAATGRNPLVVARGQHSVVDYIRGGVSGGMDTGSLERTILVVRAAGLSAQSFAGRDLIAALEARRGRDGAVSGQVNLTAFAVLALRSAGVPPPATSTRWLVSQQDQDGGFSFAGAGGQSDVDDTGAVLEALGEAPGPRDVSARSRAIAYLRGHQNRDGGFPSQPGMGSNAQSTAWATQGLDAAGVNPAGLHRHGAPSPLAYLSSLVTGDGSVLYARGESQTPVWVSGEALMALAGKALPLAPAPPPARAVARSGHRTSAPVVHRRSVSGAAAQAHRRAARRDRGGLPITRSGRRILQLSAGAGLATALALAPVGLG